MNQSISHAVILAAGQGTRLRKHQKDYLKPLYPLGGKPLISHVFEAFRSVGVKTVHVVVGFKKDELVPEIRKIVTDDMALELIDNPDWRLNNGVSLLKAKGQVPGRFFLSMSDHLFEPGMLRTLENGSLEETSLYLAVDRKLQKIFDMDDATKVTTREGRIVDIGKQLKEFDAVDTGLFVCPPGVFAALESTLVNDDCSLSDGVRALAHHGLARVVDVGDAFWQDVDTPEMLQHAEEWIASRGQGSRL